MQDFKVCAHRGLISRDYPENTILTFQKAVELGVDMIEIDVRLSKDGKIVISHDEDLLRCSGKSGLIADLTYNEILNFNMPEDQHVPLLSELLELLKSTDVVLNIEIKATEMESSLLSLVKTYKMEQQVVYSSFNASILLKIQELDPNTIRCMLSGYFTPENLDSHIKTASQVGSTFMNMSYQTCTEETVPIVQNAGYQIMAWTVDSEIYWEYLVDEIGVEVIITNLSEQLLAWKKNRKV